MRTWMSPFVVITVLAVALASTSANAATIVLIVRYDEPTNAENYSSAMELSPDGSRIFVTGYAWVDATSQEDWGTVAYDAATGRELWSRSFNGPGSGPDVA